MVLDPKLSSLMVSRPGGLPVLIPALDSPAVNAISIGSKSCDGKEVSPTDQRGIRRPVGGRADIGAIEVTADEDRLLCDGFEGFFCKTL